MSLFDLPPEILLECIEALDCTSLLVCRQVCRKLRDIIDENQACQYTLDLYTYGLEDGISPVGVLSDRYDALKRYNEGWDELKWANEVQVPHQLGTLWELYGGVLSQTTPDKDLVFTRLPAVSRGIEQKSWRIEKPSIDVRDFGMDPTQDLLVIIEVPKRNLESTAIFEFVHTFHFMSLEKTPGAVHSLAKGGPISHCQKFFDNRMSYTIQVSGDFIGTLFHTVEAGENEFIIWNWKTGKRILFVTGDAVRSFSFLSDQHVLLCVLTRGLAVIDFTSSSAEGEPQNVLEMLEIVFLATPEMNDEVEIIEFGVRADPAPAWRPDDKSNVPFHLARNNRIYVATILIQVALDALPQWVNIFIPSKTLFSAFEKANRSRDAIDTPLLSPPSLEWEEWGPHGTRLMISNVPQSTVWVCYIYGTRYVALEAHQRGNKKVWCRVYDFNDLPARRGKVNVEEENVNKEDSRMGSICPWISKEVVYEAGPLTVEAGKIFAEDVTTHLPFRWKSVELDILASERNCAVMCSEDNIIIVNGTAAIHKLKLFDDSESERPQNPRPFLDHPTMITKAPLSHARSQTFKAFYATIRSLKGRPSEPPVDPAPPSENDFILSILRSNPSLRDTRSYLASFGVVPQKPQPNPGAQKVPELVIPPPVPTAPSSLSKSTTRQQSPEPSPVITSILNPVYRRTALVKIQGPFTNVQLDSITKGLVYLEKLGLVSVIVVESDERIAGDPDERGRIIDGVMRVVTSLERQGARARPVVGPVARLGPKPGVDDHSSDPHFVPPETHAYPADLIPIKSSLRAGEIPVVAPLALDSFCRSVRVDANDLIAGLASSMMEVAALDNSSRMARQEDGTTDPNAVDLTPLRLMIINQHGGVPSYARSGLPHLLINLNQEYEHILETFDPKWKATHPTAISDLALARTCLHYMPPTSSAIMVSHKSPSSLIGNLITNKPAVSSSLPHALLQGNSKLTPHTPTLLRRGLPVQVIRSLAELDKDKMTALLEQSFGRTLNQAAFYARLEKCLDFVIIVGDYAGTAIVTNEGPSSDPSQAPISYLDKFAVLPSHQGDGTVDFLWVALHDESYGLGHPFSANPNGGKGGKGEGRDLVWRSRSNNPVNKWYFERSTGHMRMGDWVLFWADAEKRLKIEEGRRGSEGLSFVEDWEQGRLARWADVITKIPSAWA